MKISRRTALKTCSAASASAVLVTASTGTRTNAAVRCGDTLTESLKAAVVESQRLKDSSRQTANVNAQWNLLATEAGNCQRIASVILSHLESDRPASPANVQACADSCGQLILTTHVLSVDDAEIAVSSLTDCKKACLQWLSLNLA